MPPAFPYVLFRKNVIPKRYHTLAALTVFVTSCHFLSAEAHAKAVSLTGNWSSLFSGSDAEGTEAGMTQFQERYDAGWTPRITNQINMSASMGYSNIWLRDLGTRKTISPALRFDVANDIFTFDLAGYALRNNLSYSQNRESYAWDMGAGSAWQYALWPALYLNFGQSWEESEPLRSELTGSESLNRSGFDSLRSNGGAGMTWEAYKFHLLYDYSWTESEDYRVMSSQENENHLGQIEYADTYLNNRVNFSFSQTVGQNTSDATSESGNAAIRVLISSAYGGDDLTPSAGRLALNQQLIDGNFDAPAYLIRLQQPANLAIRTDFRSVDRINVYTTKDSSLLIANTSAVTWDLYTSTDGFAWQRVAERVSSSYNRDEFRFEVRTGTIRAAYVKLVVTGWLPTVNIEVTELEAEAFPTSGEEGGSATSSEQYKTEASLGIIPLASTSLSYSFSRDELVSSGTRDESENEQMAHYARFSWDYSQFFSPWAGYNTIINTSNVGVDSERRSYDLGINSRPLATLDTGISFGRNEYYEENELQFTSDSISLTTQATLYPDLNSALTLGWHLTEQELTGEQSGSYSLSWSLRSRLRKSVTAGFTTEYNISEKDTLLPVEDQTGQGFNVLRSSGESGSNSLDLSWRLSEVLSFGGRGTWTWSEGGEDNGETLALSADYLLLRTAKTNVSMNYGFNTSNGDSFNSFGCLWSWSISRFFTLRTTGSYVIAELENIWGITTQLTARF